MIALPNYFKNKKQKEDYMSVEVTESDFLQYKEVQESGMYNMFDPRARQLTTLSREQWVKIIENYKTFNDNWGEKEDE